MGQASGETRIMADWERRDSHRDLEAIVYHRFLPKRAALGGFIG
jgi:hypothetical protein